MKKGLAIKIASGVLVVALVVVVALAISGVFSAKKGGESPVVRAENASVSNSAVFRDIESDKVFYIESDRSITDINSYVSVRAGGADVDLKLSDKKDEKGNVGFTAKGGWSQGVAYRATLLSNDVAFVEEQYADMTSFVFIVSAPEALDAQVSDKVVYLVDGQYELTAVEHDENGETSKWTLLLQNVDAKYADDAVFMIDEKIDVAAFKADGELNSYAWVIDPNSTPAYNAETREYSATVVNAKVDDVFETLNVHTNVEATEDSFVFDESATAAAIYSSSLYLSTVQYLYGEQLGSKNFNVGDYGKLVLDYNFEKGSPSKVTFDATLTFTGFLKSAKNASITIKIANVLTPEFHVNFQKDPLAFDASLDLTVDTTVTVDGKLSYSFDNTDDNNNTEANTALKNTINKVAALVSDCLKSENKTDKPFIFATWVIPVGTTPIQIVESMGIEVKAEVRASLSASVKNTFSAEVGLVYVDNSVSPIANVKDDFKIGTITLAGTVETKVGLYNQIGITACGVVSINLGASVGAYCDVAGRLEMEGWEIMNGKFNIEPAYYIEAGIYLDLNVNGKVLIFNIKQQNLLNKKWPLWSSGYKYVPRVDSADSKYLATEDYYMNSSYFFFTSFDAIAIDIQNIEDTMGSERSINWDEFNYEYDASLLKMDGNKVKVLATAPNQFETDIVVVSKCNKSWRKTIHVVKTPEAPTANNPEKRYEKGSGRDLEYAVRLNTSKFIGITSNEYALSAADYDYEDNILTLKSELLETMSYGNHSLLFESSKGYLKLGVEVYSNKTIVPAGGFDTIAFDKSKAANAEIAIDLLGNEITEVQGLDEDQWVYSKSTGKFKVLASALMEEEGVVSYGIKFSNGEQGSISIAITDGRLPKLNITKYEYKIGSTADLDLDVALYNNEITSIKIGNKNAKTYLNGTAVSSAFFTENGFNRAQTVGGEFVAANQKFTFTVQLGADNMIILPTKYVEYDKAQGKDVTLYATIPAGIRVACDNVTTGMTIGSQFTQDEGTITFSAAYLNTLKGINKFELVSAADNQPEIIINVVNTTAPSVATADVTAKKGVDTVKNVAWDLQEIDIQDVAIEGLTADQYTKTADKLVLNVEALAYGVTEFKVVTPVNAFEIKVTVDGTVRFLAKDYTLTHGKDLVIKTDLAGRTLSEVKFFKDGKEVEIFPTQFRNNNGLITISNDFAYNLQAGTYSVNVYTVEGDELTGATLLVAGELTSYNAVSDGDGLSESTPYLIYNKAQFLDMIAQTNKKLGAENFVGVYFKLMADIDLEYATINPIGTKAAPFRGGFDGNGYTISNVKINDVNNEYTGLFAYNAGTISNLHVSNISVDVSKAGSVGIGLIAGSNSGNIQNVHVTGGKINAVSKSWMDIKNAYFDIGGLVGYNEGNLKKCGCVVEINAEVKGLSVAGLNIGGRKSCINVGAIVGYFKSGKVVRCEVEADINAKAHNDNVTTNGWYGNTELSEAELEESMKRCQVTIKD